MTLTQMLGFGLMALPIGAVLAMVTLTHGHKTALVIFGLWVVTLAVVFYGAHLASGG